MRHISTYYSDDKSLQAEVYNTDEITYLVELISSDGNVNRTYVDTMDRAEGIAEDFVMGIRNESSSLQ